ncbi:MAG: VWA domain-containing protein [Desulfuromonadales bacterium]|nr:VWA domain-containing protein [Desulfuromonadales bacterium]
MRDNELAGLARTLSHDTGLAITVGGDQSYCSAKGNAINIARMPATDLGRRLMCGLVFHEVGHKHYTKGAKPTGLVGELTNVIEDVRVEQLTIQRRPGARFDLDAVTTYYSERSEVPSDNLPAQLLTVVMAVGRLQQLGQKGLDQHRTTCQAFLGQQFGNRFVKRLEQLLSTEFRTLSSTTDSLRLAEQVLELVRNQAHVKKTESQQAEPQEQSGIDENESPAQDDQQGGPDQGQAGGQGNHGLEGDTDSGPEHQSAGHAGEDEAPPLDPEELEALLSAGSGQVGDLASFITKELNDLADQIPAAIQQAIPDYPAIGKQRQTGHSLDVAEALVVSARLRSRLPALLQSVRNQPVRHGSSGRRLAPNRLVRLAGGDPKVFRKKCETVAVNTAVAILLDSSGSMASEIGGVKLHRVAIDAAYALHHTLFGVPGIKVTSIEFSDRSQDQPHLRLMADFGEKPQSERFNVEPDGGTPIDKALWYARAALLPRPEPRKIILLLTDGFPNSAEDTYHATRRCVRDGIEIAAIGIMTDAVKQFWPRHRVITRLQELPQAMFEVMGEVLATKSQNAA